jgi:hypothetical protein
MYDHDLDDYEFLQDAYTQKTADGDAGPIRSIFDASFNGAPRSEMYRSWVTPELFPHEKRALVENWPDDDLEMFCGGVYAKAAYLRDQDFSPFAGWPLRDIIQAAGLEGVS